MLNDHHVSIKVTQTTNDSQEVIFHHKTNKDIIINENYEIVDLNDLIQFKERKPEFKIKQIL